MKKFFILKAIAFFATVCIGCYLTLIIECGIDATTLGGFLISIFAVIAAKTLVKKLETSD